MNADRTNKHALSCLIRILRSVRDFFFMKLYFTIYLDSE
jgi:hypothetical protein